jgi:hypothetical protein
MVSVTKTASGVACRSGEVSGGESGIRTRDGGLARTRFPGERIRPAMLPLHVLIMIVIIASSSARSMAIRGGTPSE